METIKTLVMALWQQDFQLLANPELTWLIYAILFAILILENGLLPAAFLPGDSLLFLTGILIAQGSLHFLLTLLLLVIASSLGYSLGYWQGRWLSKSALIQQWLHHIPEKYHQNAEKLLEKHGLLALLIARFTAFVRTLMPLLIGLSAMNYRRFQLINWLSGLLWVSAIVSAGFLLAHTQLFIKHQQLLLKLLTLLPVLLLLAGLLSSLLLYLRKNKKSLSR